VPVIYRCFTQYIDNPSFQIHKIPWEEWADLAKEEIDVLKILFEKNELKNFKNNTRYKSFAKRYDQRLNMLIKIGYHQLDVWYGGV